MGEGCTFVGFYDVWGSMEEHGEVKSQWETDREKFNLYFTFHFTTIFSR